MSQVTNRAELSREDFMKILVEELSQQDPMSPMENGEFLGQLVNIGNLEAISGLSANFKSLIFQNQLGSASGVLGKMVTGVSEDGRVVSGRADRLEVDGETLTLLVGGERMRFDKILEVAQTVSEEA